MNSPLESLLNFSLLYNNYYVDDRKIVPSCIMNLIILEVKQESEFEKHKFPQKHKFIKQILFFKISFKDDQANTKL